MLILFRSKIIAFTNPELHAALKKHMDDKTEFDLRPFDPIPLETAGTFDQLSTAGSELMALDVISKYQFNTEDGQPFHEYLIPASESVQRLGGYIDKIALWRDPQLLEFLTEYGINTVSTECKKYPILNTRSPQLDFYLYKCIKYYLEKYDKDKLSLFDLGCTVAEHLDFLDLLIRADTSNKSSATDILTYCGLDSSESALTAAQIFHEHLVGPNFELILSDGAEHDIPPDSFDLSISVGVINHLPDPILGLQKFLLLTREASVMALWVTSEPEGRWVRTHGGLQNYFFSHQDLQSVKDTKPGGRFLYFDYIPDTQTTNPKGYVGIGTDVIEKLGVYHLVYTASPLDAPEFLPLRELKV